MQPDRTADAAFDVADHAGGSVEVRGYTSAEVIDALRILFQVRLAQADQVSATREELVHALMSKKVSLVPPSSLRQAQRLASLRDALLATPVYTYATLAQVRREQESTTRTWFSRKRAEHRVFAVPHRGRTLIPAFQLTESGDVRSDLAAVLGPLAKAELDGWAVWSWLTRPSSLLSGGTPEDVARKSPDRAATAARRFAQRPAA
jgi:hypothetical protein